MKVNQNIKYLKGTGCFFASNSFLLVSLILVDVKIIKIFNYITEEFLQFIFPNLKSLMAKPAPHLWN